jgi:ATPase subunit of ABC transporter with duplicated ATPase domains
MPIVEVRNAGYQYPGTFAWVFRRFNMEIEPGETIRITGRNGSGKSTLLKSLSRLLELTEGEIRYKPAIKVAYMNQFSGDMLAKDLSIAEQFKAVTAPARYPSIPPADMLEQFGLGLQDRLGAFVGHLSGGERQIVALLCVVAAGANVLCLDEFTSALDERSIEVTDKALSYVKAAENSSLILVNHTGAAAHVDREIHIDHREK